MRGKQDGRGWDLGKSRGASGTFHLKQYNKDWLDPKHQPEEKDACLLGLLDSLGPSHLCLVSRDAKLYLAGAGEAREGHMCTSVLPVPAPESTLTLPAWPALWEAHCGQKKDPPSGQPTGQFMLSSNSSSGGSRQGFLGDEGLTGAR